MSSSHGPEHRFGSQQSTGTLLQEVGIFGASMMGLGSILGTGIFVSIGIAAGAAGPAVVLAIVIAAIVAACNGLSSAQLAANHPVSGGTYEYGYRWLHPTLGFIAGWMFLCAKSASAATAALGFSGYALRALGRGPGSTIPWAVGAVMVLTGLVLAGIRRSNPTNVVIVSITMTSLLLLVFAGLPTAIHNGADHLHPFFNPVSAMDGSPLSGLLEACALMFVAYTGYGRIATLGEEIRNPRENIPKAIVITLLASMTLYVAVGTVAVAAVGAHTLSDAAQQSVAPLEAVALSLRSRIIATVVSVGAITAMLGVLLNLILGISRVVLAMGRRGDLPPFLGKLGAQQSTPIPAVILVGLVISGLTAVGNVKTTWSFSAFTVLVYYALTNLAAIRMSDQERFCPRFIPWFGLLSCLFLAFWVDLQIWLTGLALIAAGLVWQRFAQRMFRKHVTNQ